MAKLFENDNSFGFISLRKLAQSYLEDDDKLDERIELAGFQRGAAWKAWNVEELWDSLLRWFPIGSILLARTKEFSEVGSRPVQLSRSAEYTEINKKEITSEDVYILIDGQQRSNAIALGFLPWNHLRANDAGARLWIDLGEPVDRSKKLFDFYLCTQDEPFGEGVSEFQKRQALTSIGCPGKDDSEIRLNESYPAKAKLPVPFAEFVQVVESEQDWEKIRERLQQENVLNLSKQTERIIIDKVLTSPTRQDIQDLLKAIQDVIIEENKNYKIPAILFRKQDDRVSPAELGKVFERINVNGVPPPPAELFFSALKLRWPEVGDYVAEISRDKTLQGLLRPTEIIHAALRMVRPEFVELSLANFDSIGKEPPRAFLGLLEYKDGIESEFRKYMMLAHQALHYRGKGDYGLPRQLIGILRPRVWHTILYWIYIHQNEIDNEISDSDRFNIVRFALMDSMNYFLFIKWWRGYSSYVRDRKFYRLLIDGVTISEEFSVNNIFAAVKKIVAEDGVLGGQELQILSPENYKAWISPPLSWNSHQAGDILLMFSQRDYLYKHETYDWDKDHIIPYLWMNFSGPVGTSTFWKLDPNTISAEDRYQILNSPGNFRYWPASLNRQYQGNKPSSKYISQNVGDTLDPNHVDRGLSTVDDVLAASFIQTDLLERIHAIEAEGSNDFRIWTTNRFNNFKQFVDERCYRMYENLYKTMRFDEIDK